MSGQVALWIALASLALSGLFSSLVYALSRASRSGVEQSAARLGKARVVRRVALILNDEDYHLAALAFPRAVLNLTVVVFLVLWISTTRAMDAPTTLDRIVGIIIGGFAVWIVSVVIPLAVAEHAAERSIVAWSWLVRGCGVMFLPVRPLLTFIMEVVRRLSGQERQTGVEELEAELMSVVEEGEREGKIDESARDMIEAVVEFGSTTVEQIMTPRTEMTALQYTDELESVKQLAKKAGHSRVPVYEDNLDHIVGVLYIKDLLRWIVENGSDNDERFTLREILRPATFVPETKTLRDLLADLMSNKVHIAIVADEYGGTSGLVTFEDIVEEIFGDIKDEYEPQDDGPALVEVDLASRQAEIDARMDIDDANDELEALGLELPEHDDYDTVGGFVVVTLGRIPEIGESFSHGTMLVSVLDAEPTRVKRIRIVSTGPENATSESLGDAPQEQPVK
ncbi:MAG: HlyC/CorC family transporter [Phycisphaeraceae bacterium]|nr:HlyC/CorC family transporter [Phycisphaeraceae bacterium]MCW5761879.1 HlyC/CorC family transporter [Phycisphaeraceae bacterium]